MNNLKKKTLACIKKLLLQRNTEKEAVRYDFAYGGINYVIISVDYSEVKVVPAEQKYSGHITIPDTVMFRGREMKVTRISRYAFFHCRDLYSVDLGHVRQIGDRAFEGCVNLQDISFNDVETIGRHAFTGCTSLCHIDFGSVRSIGRKAFRGCTALETLDFANVRTIGDGNFCGCSKLISINFRNVETLGEGVFEGCTGLTTISLGNIEKLNGSFVVEDSAKRGVFKNCVSLNTVNLDNVKEIHDCAFWGCPNITEITTSLSEPPYIDASAFHQYAYFATLYVPAGSIEAYRSHEIWSKFKIEER